MTLIERDRGRDTFLFKTLNLYTMKQTHFRQSLDPARTPRRTHWSGGEREKRGRGEITRPTRVCTHRWWWRAARRGGWYIEWVVV